LPDPKVTVVIPTLAAHSALAECLRSLEGQTFRDFEVIVVDNSGEGRASQLDEVRRRARVIENPRNLGFGAAVNQGIRDSSSPFVATINDDATAHPDCLENLLAAIEARYEIGMCAPQIRLSGRETLDSAGMLICRDGSSKQRGHLEACSAHARRRQVLLPSGCAAMYRRDMLDEIGLFDESFFLYCEDTDLGLRARWKLWECVYTPDAVVEHRYSHSAGAASALKAYYVERNRLFLVAKNFPLGDLLLSPFFSIARYFWHAAYLRKRQGKAAEFQHAGGNVAELPAFALRAWLALIQAAPRLLRERRQIQRHGRASPKQYHRMLLSYSIGTRQVAAL
jgi:GT2 family glycosyltransferase